MLNFRIIFFAGLAAIFALISTLIIQKIVTKPNTSEPAPVIATEGSNQRQKIILAANDIAFLKIIKEEDLREHFMAISDLPGESETYFSDTKAVVGQVAMGTLKKGTLIQKSDVKLHDQGNPLALEVTPGFRAVSLRVDDVKGVAGFLMRGNLVDVVAIQREKGDETDSSKIVAERARVLAVDQEVSQSNEKPMIVRSVTIETLPSQAEALSKALVTGSIQLLLRNPEDFFSAPIRPQAQPTETPRLRIIKGLDRGPAQTTICPADELCAVTAKE